MTRHAGRVAWTFAALSVIAGVARILMEPPTEPLATAVTDAVILSAFAVVGAIVLRRQPTNRIGWVLSAVGVLIAVAGVLEAWSRYLYAEGTVAPEGHAVWVAWTASWAWGPGFILAFVFLPLLFPDGRLPSRRWRPVAWASTALFLAMPASMITPGPLDIAPGLSLPDNPLGIEGPIASVAVAVDATVEVLFIPVLIAVTASLVVRWRRSRGVERQQMKWFAAAMVAVMGMFVLSMTPVPPPLLSAIEPLAIMAMPASIGIAVLRYRLYEIDRIINRALVYLGVVGILAVSYVAAVVGLQSLLAPVTGGSDLAVAASTLAAAALFGPLRRRVRTVVDRRFDRSRYDAQRTAEDLGRRVRDEVDLESLRDELVRVAGRALAPRSAGLVLLDRSGA